MHFLRDHHELEREDRRRVKGEVTKKLTDKREGRDMGKKGVCTWGEPLGILLSNFHTVASKNPAAGLGQEAVHGSHCNGIS